MTSRWLAKKNESPSGSTVRIIGDGGVSVSASHPTFVISTDHTQNLTAGNGIDIDADNIISITGEYAKQSDLDLILAGSSVDLDTLTEIVSAYQTADTSVLDNFNTQLALHTKNADLKDATDIEIGLNSVSELLPILISIASLRSSFFVCKASCVLKLSKTDVSAV